MSWFQKYTFLYKRPKSEIYNESKILTVMNEIYSEASQARW